MARRRAGGGRRSRPTTSAPRSSRSRSAAARSHPWPHVPRDGTGRARSGSPIISRLPARVVGTLPVGHVFADHDAGTRRRCTSSSTSTGRPVDLVGVHLTSRLPHGPPIQLRRLAPQLPPPGRPAVVAGDCNFWGPGVRTFLPGWRRAVRGRTWPASRPHSQIDHILVRPEIGVVNGEVLGDVGSDHRPVRATLRVGLERPACRQLCVEWCRSRRARRSRSETIVVPDPGPGEALVQRAGVRRVPHRPALPRGRDQRRLPVPARPRGRGHRSSRSAPTCATSRPATS